MALPTTYNVYPSSGNMVELRPPIGGRRALALQNKSAAVVYMNEGTLASANDGIQIQPNETVLFSPEDDNVPQNSVFILGSVAAGQIVTVREKAAG